MKQKAVVLCYPGSIIYEVSTAISILSENFKVHFAGPTKESITDSSGLVYNLDSSFEELNSSEYKVAIIPGGDFHSILSNKHIDFFLKEFVHNQNNKLGAICNGVCVAAKSGVLNNTDCTHTAHPSWASKEEFRELLDLADQIFAGSNFIDKNIVVDRNILTAKPWAQIDFGIELGIMSGVIPPNQRQKVYDYQHGNFGKPV